MPGWPSPLAQLSMRSQKAREPAPGPGIAQMRFLGFASTMRANTPKPPPRKCSDTSCISMGLRRSGLSEPYFWMAVRKGMRGKAPGVTVRAPANSSNTPRITGSMVPNTSSCVTKLISRSSW